MSLLQSRLDASTRSSFAVLMRGRSRASDALKGIVSFFDDCNPQAKRNANVEQLNVRLSNEPRR